MLSDAKGTKLEPLVEVCRPKGKTPPHDLRRTFPAILRRHQNGAEWCAIPEELGPWCGRLRYSFAGREVACERLPALVQPSCNYASGLPDCHIPLKELDNPSGWRKIGAVVTTHV